MKIDVSIGEVVDKITILEIKEQKIKEQKKLSYVKKELNLLKDLLLSEGVTVPEDLADELRSINKKLWDTEDIIRELEIKGDFGKQFVEHARLDAKLNDKRFLIKNKINNFCNSQVKEQKSYEGLYTAD
jgi:hypothetical protein